MRAFLSFHADRWLIRPNGGAPPAFFGISRCSFDKLGTAGSGAHTGFRPDCKREGHGGRRAERGSTARALGTNPDCPRANIAAYPGFFAYAARTGAAEWNDRLS